MPIITVTFKDGVTVSGYHNGKTYNGAFYLAREGYKSGKRYSIRDVAYIKFGRPWEHGKRLLPHEVIG